MMTPRGPTRVMLSFVASLPRSESEKLGLRKSMRTPSVTDLVVLRRTFSYHGKKLFLACQPVQANEMLTSLPCKPESEHTCTVT